MNEQNTSAPVKMSTKNTPGPWKWEEGTQTITRHWNGLDVCVAQVKGADLHWHEDRRVASVEAGANARLIAAAPELLAALEVALCDLNQAQEETHIDFRGSIEAVRAAIAKATNP